MDNKAATLCFTLVLFTKEMQNKYHPDTQQAFPHRCQHCVNREGKRRVGPAAGHTDNIGAMVQLAVLLTEFIEDV